MRDGASCDTGLISQGDDVFPIPGSRNPLHVEENVAALEFSKTLTAEEIAELEAAVPAAQVRPLTLTQIPTMTLTLYPNPYRSPVISDSGVTFPL